MLESSPTFGLFMIIVEASECLCTFGYGDGGEGVAGVLADAAHAPRQVGQARHIHLHVHDTSEGVIHDILCVTGWTGPPHSPACT